MRRNKFIKGEKVVLDTGKSTYFVTVMDWFTVDGKTWYNLAEDHKPFCFWGQATETQLRARQVETTIADEGWYMSQEAF